MKLSGARRPVSTIFVLSSLMLCSCASIGRVKGLEARMGASDANIKAVEGRLLAAEAFSTDTSKRVDVIEGQNKISDSRILALEDKTSRAQGDVARIEARVSSIEKILNWSGRFQVKIAPDGNWHVLYANSTGQSQRLRIRRISNSGEAQVRVGEISKIAGPLALPGTDSGVTTGVIPPSWDMSSEGSQRWQRIGCGQELSGRAVLLTAEFDLFVTLDPNPVKC